VSADALRYILACFVVIAIGILIFALHADKEPGFIIIRREYFARSPMINAVIGN
jgi:hypothetical protein